MLRKVDGLQDPRPAGATTTLCTQPRTGTVAIATNQNNEHTVSTKNALDMLQELVKDELLAVNHTIVNRMQSSVNMIPHLAGHLISAGGKRLRPILTLLCSRLCGYHGTRHIPLAACVEFIHTATLLHDDVVDDSSLRRGNESANVLWGNQASVLVGDFLFSRAFQIMVEDGSLRVLEILSSASAVIAEGEVQQLANANNLNISEQNCLEVITAKTATLFAAACEIGSVVADQPPHISRALASFGLNFGISFQLIDDTIDYAASESIIGKTVGDDFREGKVTLPVLLAYMRGGPKDHLFWKRTIERGDLREDDLAHAIGLMKKHEVLEDVRPTAAEYVTAACDALEAFPPSPERNALVEAAKFSTIRAY